MLEIARYETERRIPGTAAIAVGLSIYAGLFLAIGPSIIDEVDLEAYAEALPPAFQSAFGVDAIGTLEGLFATELYQFGWILLLGLYFAYSAGDLIAGDVERERLDLLLSSPVSRVSVLLGKFASLLTPIVVVNVVVGVVVYFGAAFVGDPLSLADVAMVHLLSIPYLLACAGLGLLISVSVSRGSLAQRGAMGVVFGLFMLESFVAGTDYEWLGTLSPTRYYDPTAILVDGTYDLLGAAILLEVAALLVIASALQFQRRDI
ncbi:ABC transporter permease subunit [Halogeometricum sp. CBA1124]|uniref:ABC transporter permease subunit n=1 Tax=Halogeometricum sp. CBA1124 TaxID=2668071 RepID=UPI00142B4B46|nr:ABC transporter permease subunit [Halogeometricum sp. CBA1124]